MQVSVYDEYGNFNSAEYNIELIGFSNASTQILMVENPNEVIIPSGNDELIIPFTAKVKDADGQSNIDQVFIEFINSDGSILVPNPNTLLDNGLNDTLLPTILYIRLHLKSILITHLPTEPQH